jgi:KDEL-tailed cysteine endopeptidase
LENSLRGSAVLSSSNSFIIDEIEEWTHFTNFQEKFSRKYETIQELESRFQTFRSNLRNILMHNLDHTQNFTLGVNQFTDLTQQEFKAKYLGGLKSKTQVGSYGCKTFSSSTSFSSSLPDSVDWRLKGVVTPVKDQGQCGSCWAFSATGAISAAVSMSKGQLVDLSEEQLVDCATGIQYGSHGCNGGQMDGGFKYVINNGQCAESAYPYTSGSGKSGSCQTCSSIAKISSCNDVTPNDQLALKAAVAQQPVAIALSADTLVFQSYSKGILTASSCYTELDHGVLIVGYGEENGQKYWTVKNSWSETWGDAGYIRIGRSESTNDAGICGIAMDASFPTV